MMSMTAVMPLRKATPERSPLILACLAATWLIWGSTYLAIKWALVSFPPLFQMGTRFVAAGLVLGLFMAGRGSRWPRREEWRSAFILGALMLGGGYGATAYAEMSVSSGLVVAFIAVTPAMVALCQWPYGLRPSRWEAAGIGLGLAGLAMLLACSCWSIGSVWARHGMPGGRRLTLAPGAAGYASQMLVGGVLLLIGSWVAGEQPTLPPDARSLACWAYLVVAGSLLGFSAYMVLLQRTSAALASSYSFVNPLIGLLLGVVFGGEVVSASESLAAAVVAGGVVLLLVTNSAASAAPPRESR
jgi:drug/metabolite transporter (DMT)-like permease